MNYPGTGPFRHVSRKDKEVWIMEKNPNYWNKGLPYVDKLEVYHMPPFSPELGAAFLSGKLDYARLLDPVSWRKAKEMPGVTAAAFNQSVIQAVWLQPEEESRSATRACAGPCTSPWTGNALVEVVKDTAPDADRRLRVSVPRVLDARRRSSRRSSATRRTSRPAIQEAKKLMAEAGYGRGIKGLDFLVREANTFKLWAVAIQAMLKEHLNIETQPARRSRSRSGSRRRRRATSTSASPPSCPR